MTRRPIRYRTRWCPHCRTVQYVQHNQEACRLRQLVEAQR